MTGKNSRWSLHGKTALVTGGTRGIGRAIVEELAELGAIVYTCSRNQKELNQLLNDWASKGYQVSGAVCDVSSGERRTELVKKVSILFNGKLDILVNNAGICIEKAAIDYTLEDCSRLMTNNFVSAYHFCQLAHPHLKATGDGNIVFISSVAGIGSVHLSTAYGATKAAMNQLTRNLACEWAQDNIRVNSAAPWIIETSLVEDFLAAEGSVEQVAAATPLQRPGKPEEVSSLVAYLCFPAASFITGQVIAVDGGFSTNFITWR